MLSCVVETALQTGALDYKTAARGSAAGAVTNITTLVHLSGM
jgi:hypothetical protein